MEDIRSYQIEEENERLEEERREFEATSRDEVPFHVPRD